MKSKAILIAIVVLVFASVVGVSFAQEDDAPPVERPVGEHTFLWRVMDVVTEVTGLTPAELRAALEDGNTLAEVIEANDGDVDAIINEIENRVGEQIETLFNTEFELPDRNRPIRDRLRAGVMGEVASAVSEATGLTLPEIAESVRDGATIAELITDNNGDVDAVIETVVAAITDEINERVASEQITQEQADMLLDNLESTVTNVINGEFELGERGNRGRGQGFGN